MIDTEEEIEKTWKKLNEKVNYITKFLNENEINYEVKMWDSGEGKDIIIGDVVIAFYKIGLIKFTTKKEIENE